MSWTDALTQSKGVIPAYIGLSLLGVIPIGIGLLIMGGATASGEFGLGVIFGFLFLLTGYIWIFVVAIALQIKLISDTTAEVVSDNFRRNNDLLKLMIQESR